MNYTAEMLEKKTRDELRAICDKLDIHVNSKSTKTFMIDEILDKDHDDESDRNTYNEEGPEYPGGIDSISSVVHAHKSSGNDLNLLVSVSCGASSGNFPVVGKTVSEVSETLKSILNISTSGEPIVNGSPVGLEYKVKLGDVVEFVTVTSRKG